MTLLVDNVVLERQHLVQRIRHLLQQCPRWCARCIRRIIRRARRPNPSLFRVMSPLFSEGATMSCSRCDRVRLGALWALNISRGYFASDRPATLQSITSGCWSSGGLHVLQQTRGTNRSVRMCGRRCQSLVRQRLWRAERVGRSSNRSGITVSVLQRRTHNSRLWGCRHGSCIAQPILFTLVKSLGWRPRFCNVNTQKKNPPPCW